MRVAFVSVVCSAVVLCGCAGRAYRPTGSPEPAGMPGPTGGAAGDSSSGLGLPTEVIPEASKPSSSFKPTKKSSPTLGPLLPAAKRETADGKLRAAQLHAPD